MKNQKIDLALAFLQSQPAAAANILEQQPIENVAEFLGAIPHTYAALVLEKMLPQYTARICRSLDTKLSAGFLSEMPISLVAAIIRHSDKALHKQILSLLPERIKLACQLLLNYSEDAVGAWMVVNIITLPGSSTVKEAISRLALEENTPDLDVIYIVDRERLLKGSLKIMDLLSAKSSASIKSIMQKKTEVISGRTALISAANNIVWTSKDNIAVINRYQQLVGVLRHVDLRKGLDQISTKINKPRGSDSLTGICEVYGSSLLALFSTVGEIASSKTA